MLWHYHSDLHWGLSFHIPIEATAANCFPGVASEPAAAPSARFMYCFASPANVSMMASTTSPAKALRVLCLHGYCQNAAVFKNKIGSLRKVLRRDANVELVFVDAPHTAQTELLDSKEDRINSREKKSAEQDIVVAKNLNGEDAKRAWWLSSDGGRAYNGFHTTIDYLNNIFMEQVCATLFSNLWILFNWHLPAIRTSGTVFTNREKYV